MESFRKLGRAVHYYVHLILHVDKKRLLKLFRTLATNPSIIYKKRRYIFVLGHMRSYSSLLSHILGSHPQIDGNSEQHLHYKTTFDLIRLCVSLRLELNVSLEGDYVLDKILHNGALSPNLMRAQNIEFLILVRKPRSSLISLYKMFERRDEEDGWQESGSYYCSRLTELTNIAEKLGQRAIYLQAEHLLERTESVLRWLKLELGLSTPLSEQYQTFPKTGLAGSGDESHWIRKGKIIRSRDRQIIEPPKAILSKCEAHYTVLLETLNRFCKQR